MSNMANLTEGVKTTPIRAEQTVRRDEKRAITSGDAGHMIPLGAFPLLREDRCARGSMSINLEMMETAETLMTGVTAKAQAYFVPFLAFDRFMDIGQLNRSYKGEPEADDTVIPFIETAPFNRAVEFYRTLGMHAPQDEPINTAYLEAYNTLWNWRARTRSTKITERGRLTGTIAPAFWPNPGKSHIVPDFDQAMIDGELSLNIEQAFLPVQGIGFTGTAYNRTNTTGVRETDGNTRAYPYSVHPPDTGSGANAFVEVTQTGFPAVFAELADQNIKLSLANIERAKETVAFATIRKQMAGLSDDYILDLLMEGIRVPDTQMAQPILLDSKSTVFGYDKRYATDGANLDQHVTTGMTRLNLRWRTPPMNTGGIIMVVCEIVPEQMFERQKDHFLYATDVADLPSFTRDYLDPEKVDVVTNNEVDVLHSTPDGVFGYAPLNHGWKRSIPGIGGKFLRPNNDAFNEDRQRIWSVEQLDPALTEDFYVVGALHNKVFSDTEAEAFEITSIGGCEIIGNTVFGQYLNEDTGDYQAIDATVDDDRIEQQ